MINDKNSQIQRMRRQLPPIFRNTGGINQPAVPPTNQPVIPLPPLVDEPVAPLPPLVDEPVIPLPPLVDEPVVPLPPLVTPPVPTFPQYPTYPNTDTYNLAIQNTARDLLTFLDIFSDSMRLAYDLSYVRTPEYRNEIRVLRDRGYSIYEDAMSIVGQLPQMQRCVNCEPNQIRTYGDAVSNAIKYGDKAKKKIVDLIYLNKNRNIDAQLLLLYLKLNEELKNIKALNE